MSTDELTKVVRRAQELTRECCVDANLGAVAFGRILDALILEQELYAPEEKSSSTLNGYDPRWVDALNDVLLDRGVKVRAVDLDDSVWERFLGPLADAYEDEDVDADLLA